MTIDHDELTKVALLLMKQTRMPVVMFWTADTEWNDTWGASLQTLGTEHISVTLKNLGRGHLAVDSMTN